MRPRIKVVLLAWTQVELSLWRIRLQVRGYDVYSTTVPAEAARLVAEIPEVRVVLAQAVANPILSRILAPGVAPGVQAVVFAGQERHKPGTLAHTFLLTTESAPGQVLDAVDRAAKRKRGPKRRVRFVRPPVEVEVAA